MQRREKQDTIRTIKGFLLSILLHLLILLLFWVSTEKIFFAKPAGARKKIVLDLAHFTPPPPKPKHLSPPPPRPIVPPQPKPELSPKKEPEPVKKVLEKRKILTARKDVQENNITKSPERASAKQLKKRTPEPKKKIVKREKRKKKRIVKKLPPKAKKAISREHPSRVRKKSIAHRRHPGQYRSSLANSLMGGSQARSSREQIRNTSGPSGASRRMIRQLYGSEFNGYSPEQKKFIKNNLGLIHRITQMTLIRNGYPEIAARTGQQGINVVSFYLHPNGNITGLHLDKYMGYEALDRNTLQVIRIAYKDYPLPTKTTKIKFFVQYSINGY